MTESTDLANRALTLLGADRITSLDPPDENNTGAAVMARLYEPAKKGIIREYQWNCAKEQRAFAQLADPPLFGFNHAYGIDPDVLRILFIDRALTQASGATATPIYTVVPHATFKVVGQTIHTNQTRCWAMCMIDIEETKMDSLLQDALVYKLAHQACYPITRSSTAKDGFKTDFKDAIGEARANNAIEGSSDKTTVDGLSGARITGWRGARDY